jgi:hypothetical protein
MYRIADFNTPLANEITYQGTAITDGKILRYNSAVGGIGLQLASSLAGYLYKDTAAGELVVDLNNCVVRTAPNIYAQNTLTFPANEDGSSIVLVGDTSISQPYGKASWWAVSQDGGVYFDNTLVEAQSGILAVNGGTGISATTTSSVVSLQNTGVTQITAGTGISINQGTGNVTVSAATAPSGVLQLALGKVNFANDNTQQPSVSSYVPLWNGVAGNYKSSGICIIGPNNFTLSIDSFNAYTYLTWNGANPIALNISADCSWYSTSGSPFPTGADAEFTNTNTNVNSYAYSAVNFGIEIQEQAGGVVPQVLATSLGPSSISWLATYGGTLAGTAYMKQGSYLRFTVRTNYSFNNTWGSAGSYFASCNMGGYDTLKITAYESPYPA